MTRLTMVIILALLVSMVFVPTVAAAGPSPQSCWGQATAVFAQTGVMGEHASSFPTPRLGLRNLARALYGEGILEDDTMQALGAFVVAELGLDVAACR